MKLVQNLANESFVLKSNDDKVTEKFRNLTKVDLLGGLTKEYASLKEDGEHFPPENKNVTFVAKNELLGAASAIEDLFNHIGARDMTNASGKAKADIVIDGKVILKDVPTSHLLFIGKRLTDISTIIHKLPVLDPSKDWKYDSKRGMYATEPIKTAKTKKESGWSVITPAVPGNNGSPGIAAQLKEVSSDVVTGYYTKIEFSTAFPAELVNDIKARVNKLQLAVKIAREEANTAEVIPLNSGTAITEYLFGSLKTA